jgi:hypothetical protein
MPYKFHVSKGQIMNKKLLVAFALIMTMASCQLNREPLYWSKGEIEAIIDLKELGIMARDAEGYLTIGGKRLTPETADLRSYGKSYNLLRLSDDALNSLNPQVADALFNGNTEQIKTAMQQYGLTPSDFQTAWKDGNVSVQEMRSLITISSQRTGSVVLQQLAFDREAQR